MADASNAQTSFLGGEWSSYAQGKFDDPDYKRGMNVCRNGHPIEAGAWTRRAGTRHKGFTRKGQDAKVIQFSFSQNAPYDMEFTDGFLRFYDSQGPIMSEEPRRVLSIDRSSPARVSTRAACSEITPWADGDQVMFFLLADGVPDAAGILLGRQFTIRMDGDEDHFFLYDGITQEPIEGDDINFSVDTPLVVARIYEIATPYDNGSWAQIKSVQDGDSIVLLHPTVRPYQIFAPIDGGNLFTLNASQPVDGPYLDPPVDGSFLTVSGTTGDISCSLIYPTYNAGTTYKNGTRFITSFQSRSGSVSTSTQFLRDTVVISAGIYYVSLQDGNVGHTPASSPTFWRALGAGQIFGPNGLTLNDVGRCVRLLAQPEDWNVATAYAIDELVNYLGAYYVALTNHTGKVPGTDVTNWGVASNAAKWTWGIITAVGSDTSFTMTILGDDLLYNQNVTVFRFGAWSDSTRWPSSGTFHEGRFWLGGAVKNRFDASAVFGNTMEFSPTAPDGTVSDANGISYTLKSPQQNLILWMLPDRQGIIMGTAQGEWLVQSSANNDPITPTSIQAHNFTTIGSADVEAIRTGMSTAFVQRIGKKLMDYVGDPFGNFAGLNLAERSKHLTAQGIKRIAYQHELSPTIWALTNDNKLVGTTYKRESVMPGQAPVFNGWHRHDLGSGFDIIDMCASSSPDGLLDSITLVVKDPDTGVCSIETVTELFDEESSITDAWFVDKGIVPSSALITTINTVEGVLMTGFGPVEGETVSAFVCGLDLGDFLVTDGQIFLPFTDTFTLALIQSLDADNYDFSFRIQYDNPNAGAMTMMEFPPLGSPYMDNYNYLTFGAVAVADWAHDRVTFLLQTGAPYAGLVQYRISTGALIKYAKVDEVFGSPVPPYYDPLVNYPGSPMVLGSDGEVYIAKVSGSKGADPTTVTSNWQSLFALPADYNAGTSYAVGDLTKTGGIIYKSLQAANMGHTPASSPTFWQPLYSVPAAWDEDTVYDNITVLTGAGPLGFQVLWYNLSPAPAGTGEPTTLGTNNPYWVHGNRWGVGAITSGGLGLDFNGDIYMYQTGVDGPDTYIRISGDTLKVVGRMTAAPGQAVPVPANYAVPLRILSNNFDAQADYILYTVNETPLGQTDPAAVLMRVGSLMASENKTFIFDEGGSPLACRGSVTIGTGQAFVLTNTIINYQTDAVGLYEINAFAQSNARVKKTSNGKYKAQDPNKGIYGNYGPQGSALRKAGTISPSDIDPTWNFFTSFTGLLYDNRDGNVITSVGSANPVLWVNTTKFTTDGESRLSFTLGSDDNVYRFVRPALVYSTLVTYAINNIVANVVSGTITMYKSLANGNLNNALSDVTKWVEVTFDPVLDVTHTYWTLIGPKADTLNYLVKFSTDCAQLVWRIADVDFGTISNNVPFINIDNGHFAYVRTLGFGNFDFVKINTITGTMTASPISGVAPLGYAQIYNDKTGDIIFYPQYNGAATDAPPPVDPEGGTTETVFTTFARLNIVPDSVYTVPGVVGFTYTSQGQLLRPVSPAESGARNGPAFGKTRRNHRYATMVASTAAISFGSEFTKVRPALFKSRAGKGALLLTAATLYTGEHSDTVEGDYDLDGMLCWQITRPLPATVDALGGFLQTQDR